MRAVIGQRLCQIHGSILERCFNSPYGDPWRHLTFLSLSCIDCLCIFLFPLSITMSPCKLCVSARIAITKYHTGWVKPQTFIFFTVLKTRNARSRCRPGSSLLRLLRGWRLPLSSHGLPSVRVCVLINSSCKACSHIGLGLTLVASFSLNYLFQDPTSLNTVTYLGSRG